MSTESHHQSLGRHHAEPYRYYNVIMAGCVMLWLLSNLIGAGKGATVNRPVVGDLGLWRSGALFPHQLCDW